MHEFIVECFKKTFVKKYFRDELGICQVYFSTSAKNLRINIRAFVAFHKS